MTKEMITEMVGKGKKIQFLKTNDMIGVNCGVVDDLPACDRFFRNLTRICVSPAVYSFIEDQATRGKVYSKFQVKDGEKTNWIGHYISGEL